MADTLKKPGDEDSEILDLTDSPLNVESNPTAGVLKTTIKALPSQIEDRGTSFAPEEKTAIARMVTGATPALLGMLFGASPLTAEDQIQQGQKYYEGGTPKKLVMTVGDDGSPIYTDSRDAVGQKAYQKPLRGFAPGAGMVNTTMINRTTGESTSAIIDKVNNRIIQTGTNNILDPQQWTTDVPTLDLKNGKDEYGRNIVAPINKFAPGNSPASPKVIAQSESSVLGMGPQGLVNANRGARQALAPINQATARIANNMIADRELARAQNGGVTGADIAAKIGILRTFAPAGVSSPEEMQRSSVINQAIDTITKFGSNKVPPDYITEFRNLLKNDTETQRQLAQQYGKNAVQAQPTQAAKNYLQSTIPQMPPAPSAPPPASGTKYTRDELLRMTEEQRQMILNRGSQR